MGKIDDNIVIILNHRTRDGYGLTGYGNVYAHIAIENNGLTTSHNDGMLLNPMLDNKYGWDAPYHQLSNLRVSAQHDMTDKPGTYGWNVEYSDVSFIRMDEAETMFKQLRKITREMGKIESQFGYADDFGGYVTRFASIIGCNKYAVYTQEMQPNGTRYRYYDAQSMRTWIKQETTKHIVK